MVRRGSWLRAVRLVFGLVLLAAVIVVVGRLGEARHFAGLVERAQPAWLLLAVFLQTATYVCAAGVWWYVLRRASSPQPLRTLVSLSIGKLLTDQALPSGGITGSALMVRGAARRGTPLPAAMAAVVVGLLTFYAAMIASTAASLVVFWRHHEANAALIVMTALLVTVAAVVSSILVILVRGRDSRMRAWLARQGPARSLLDSLAQAPRDVIRDRATLSRALVLQLANVVLDAATLQATLAAVGEQVTPSLVFASFVFANIVEIIGIAPGGVGTFEGACVALLHVSGVRLEAALAATLLLRGFTFWLPMLPGTVVVRRELRAPSVFGVVQHGG